MSSSYLAIAQARLTSARFPGKVLKKISTKTLIEHVNDYCKYNFGDNYIFAIPNTDGNDKLFNFLKTNNLPAYRGDENNVLKRYRDIIKKFQPEFFIRITSDNPYKCPQIVDEMVDAFIKNKMKVLTNSVFKTFPLGLEIEIIDSDYFLSCTADFSKSSYLEHVTLGIYNEFTSDLKHFMTSSNNSDIRLTIDYERDLILIKKINEKIKNQANYSEILEHFNQITKSNRTIGDYYIK